MRESNQPDVVFILDTLPECSIVLSELEHPSRRWSEGESLLPSPEFLKSIHYRFRRETQREPYMEVVDGGPAFQELEWRDNPEFRVRAEDVDIVSAAAGRVLQERNLLRKAANKLSGKQKAARNIAWALSHLHPKDD